MAQKKESTENKPGVKVQDLSPKKDAKGGASRGTQGASLEGNRGLQGNRNLEGNRSAEGAGGGSAS